MMTIIMIKITIIRRRRRRKRRKSKKIRKKESNRKSVGKYSLGTIDFNLMLNSKDLQYTTSKFSFSWLFLKLI